MAAFSLVGLSPVPHELPVAVEAWDRLVGGCSSAWALAVRVQEDTSTMSVSGRSVLGCDAMDGGAASGPGATPRTGSSACGAEDLPSPLIWAASTGGDVSSAEYWSQVSSVSVFEDVDGDGRVSPAEAAEHALPASGPSDGAVSWRQCLVARVRFSSGVAGLSTSHIVVRGARVGGCGAASASAPFVSDPSSSFPSRVWDVPLVIDTAGDGLAVSVTLDGAQTGTTPRFNETSLVFSWQYRVGFASPVSGFDAGRDLQLEGLQVVPAGLESGVVASPAPSRQAVWSVEVEATGASSRIAATLLPYGAHACSSSVLAVNSTSSQAVDDVGARCSSCLPRVAATDAAYSVQRQFNASVLNASLVTAPSLNASEVALSEGGKTLVPRSWALLRFSVPVCRVPMAAFSLVGLSPVPHELPGRRGGLGPSGGRVLERVGAGCPGAGGHVDHVGVRPLGAWMRCDGRRCRVRAPRDSSDGSSACGAEDLPSPLIWAASTGGDVSSAEYWSQVSSVSVFEDVDGDGRVFPSRVWDVPLVIDTAGDGLAVSVTLDGAQTGTTPRFNETSLVFSWQYRVRPTFIQLREVLGAVGSAPGANGSGVVVNGSTRSTRLVVEVGFASPVSGFDAGRDLQLEGLQVVPAGLESGVVASPAPSRQAVWSVEVEATGASSRIAATLLPYGAHACSSSVLAVNSTSSQAVDDVGARCSSCLPRVAATDAAYSVQRQFNASVLNASLVTAPSLNASEVALSEGGKTLVPRSWALLRFSVPVCRVPMAAFSLVGLSPVPHELPVAVEAWDRLVGGCSSAWALAVRVQEDTSTMSVSGRSVLGCDAMDGGAASGPGATPRTGSSACGAEDLPSPLIWAASTGGDVSSAEYWSQVSSVSVFEDVDGDGRVSPVEAAEHALPASGPSDGAVSWRQCLVARVRFSSGVAGLSTSHIVVRGARVGGCGAASASAPFVSDPSSSFPSRVWDVPLVIDTAGDGLAVSVTLDGAQTGTTPRFNETSLVFSWQYRVRPTFIQLREVLGAVGSAPGANGSGVVVNGSTRSTRLVVEVGFASPVSGFDAGRDLQLEGLQVVPAGLESGVVASPAPSRQAVWSVEVEATGASSRIAATLLPFSQSDCVSAEHTSQYRTSCSFIAEVVASQLHAQVLNTLNQSASLVFATSNKTLVPRSWALLRFSVPVCRVPMAAFSLVGLSPVPHELPVAVEAWDRLVGGCSSAWALAVRVQEDTSTMSVSGRSVLGCDAMDGGAASGPGATPRTGSSACGAEDLPSPLIWAASTGGDVSSAEYWSQVSSVSVFEDVDGDGRVSPVEAAEHALPASGPSDGAVSWRQCLVARVRFSSGVAGLSTSHIVVRGARVGGHDPRVNETSLVFSWQYRVRPTFIQLREVLGAVGSAPGANGSGVVVNGSTRSTRLVVEVGFASPVSGFDAGRDLQLEGLQVVPAGLESGVVASPAPSRQAVWSVEVEATGASSRIAATLLPFGEFECFSSAVSLTHAAGLGSFGLCSTALPRIARTRAGSFVATGRFFVFPVSASIQELPVADPLLDTMEGNFTSALRLFMVLRYSAPVCRVPIHAFSVSGVQVSAEAVPFGLEQSERRSSGCSLRVFEDKNRNGVVDEQEASFEVGSWSSDTHFVARIAFQSGVAGISCAHFVASGLTAPHPSAFRAFPQSAFSDRVWDCAFVRNSSTATSGAHIGIIARPVGSPPTTPLFRASPLTVRWEQTGPGS
ncbi:hypothetical protein FNF27_05040 [Cafeteria roenbergensis]|uniref:Uncharacterized protein n=1 Tax=Cafeteria roenbergensis TaxID=33653 RepID=A0A5A8E6X7_CAFRO|nr:hypothetical protein FNF27_05040 [Cafeteria roenbergensis]